MRPLRNAEWTINDGVFNLSYTDIADNWYDAPSDRHNQGCNLSFADGHAGHIKWRWPTPARRGPFLKDSARSPRVQCGG
ncbi:MAG: hypothetical protein DME22_24355 [Verrucomicrobia bacterium]|nr:MAG: hypothetical protein DME22_24355 [Verrucomicrobiota bacterium]